MKLYKNVDIKDLKSILEKGILSLNASGNDMWDEGNRANNSCDVVYMFKTEIEQNAFCQYGIALIEIEMPEDMVQESEFVEHDTNKGKYVEYIAEYVAPEMIESIYIPELFKNRLQLPEIVEKKVVWCGLRAKHYKHTYKTILGSVVLVGVEEVKSVCSEEVLEQFAKTAKLNTCEYMYFRGVDEHNNVFDLYDIVYIF